MKVWNHCVVHLKNMTMLTKWNLNKSFKKRKESELPLSLSSNYPSAPPEHALVDTALLRCRQPPLENRGPEVGYTSQTWCCCYFSS